MEEIGNFIFNEYGLIKHIFKYLPNRDLYRARHVCRSWRSAVDIMMEKKPIWTDESTDNFDRRIRPKFILLYTDSTRNARRKYICPGLRARAEAEVPECKTTKFCECKYIDKETVVCVLDSPKLLRTPLSKRNKGTWPVPTTQCSSLFMLPEVPGVEFSTFSMSNEELVHFIEDVNTEEAVDALIGKEGGPLKCILLFTSSSYPLLPMDEKALDKFVTKIEEGVKHRFALGGGVLRRQHVIRNGSKSSATILGIAIKGENVSAHSQIRVDHDGSDDSYMKQLADRVGPSPDNHSRIAFIVQCVNKDQYMVLPNYRQKVKECDYELNCFTKHFPSVPIFGFMGFGEFGFDLAKMYPYGNPEKKRKTKHIHHVQYTDSSSIVIVTFSQQKVSPSGGDRMQVL